MLEEVLNNKTLIDSQNKELFTAIFKDAGKDISTFVVENISLEHPKSVFYFPEKGTYEHEVDYSNIRSIVDFRKVNYSRDINKYFISVNKLLPDAGLYIGCFESYQNRKAKIFKKVGKTLGLIIWVFDLVLNRILPKLNLTKDLYKLIRGNKYKVISLAETLGRTVYCGFEVVDFKVVGNSTYFCVIKTSEPKNDKDPSYGPFFKMQRIGKGGKTIGVYKLRTMHPYSEYLQNFVVQLNGYDEVGKPKNDFRVAGWGKVLRKVWLDELPQILNVLKGELGLVGVRPLSQFRYNQLPLDIRKQRIKYKPGCIPPYVALNMPDAIGNIEAERIYIMEMKKNKLVTPVRYFFMAVFNILSRRIQSA